MGSIPQVIKDFLGSEKAIAAGLLVVAATVFVLTGKISFADWQTYTTNLLGIYVAGKTIQGTAAVLASRKPPDASVNGGGVVTDKKAEDIPLADNGEGIVAKEPK